MTRQFTELKVDPSYQSNFPFFFFLSFITDRYSRNPGLISHNVSICVRAGLPKPRGVPDTERNKDTKTFDYTSTPLDANTLLAAAASSQSQLFVQCHWVKVVGHYGDCNLCFILVPEFLVDGKTVTDLCFS